MNTSPLTRLRGAYLASLRSYCALEPQANPQIAVEIGRTLTGLNVRLAGLKAESATSTKQLHKQNTGTLCMTITDDGRGFQVDGNTGAKTHKRLGLLGMRERVEMLGGTFSVESAPGHATSIRVELAPPANDPPHLPFLAGLPGNLPTRPNPSTP